MLRTSRIVAGIVLVAGIGSIAVAAIARSTAAGGGSTTVVMSNLNNPRHVHVASDGAIYVAEAGAGGRHCSGPSGDKTCIGFSSSVTRYLNGSQRRVVSGLVSAAGKDGSFAVGGDDAVVSTTGAVFSIETSAGRHTGLPRSYTKQLGRLLVTSASGKRRSIARVDRFEFRHNPDKKKIDSNPYALAIDPRGGWVVADAAANDLLHVTSGGRVTLLATFKGRRDPGSKAQSDSVPTCVVAGPDGAFYVGELRGDKAPKNSARIWRVVPGHAPTVYATGFNRVSGLDFGPDGSLYVAELTTAAKLSGGLMGAVIQQAPDGTRTELAPRELNAPGGVGVGPDGTVYVSVNSVFARRGRVVSINGTGPGPSPSPSASSASPIP
jgi:sugar lactone lactonase YvrE